MTDPTPKAVKTIQFKIHTLIEAKQAYLLALGDADFDAEAPKPNKDLLTDPTGIVTPAFVAKARQVILGVDSFAVGQSLMEEIFYARATKSATNLIQCAVFAVALAYSTSATWVGEYEQLDKPNVFTPFEVSDRKVEAVAKGEVAVEWVAKSKMNSHAVHILGHLIVSMARAGGFLGAMRTNVGTMHIGSKLENARGVIMKEAFEAMPSEERAVPTSLKQESQRLVDIVDAIFGKSGGDLEQVILTVAALKGGII